MKSGALEFAIADPDAPENWPRVWFIWRANALGSSARGQEYFFKFLLGTHNNLPLTRSPRPHLKELKYKESPLGKLDLIVDLNMRMNTTPTYCDIVLPTAHWYEKEDINTTELHSFIHPMGAAVTPNWEAKSDWDAFKFISQEVLRDSEEALPEAGQGRNDFSSWARHPGRDRAAGHNGVQDWKKGQCEAIPGKTMPNLSVVTRGLRQRRQDVSRSGPLLKTKYGFHGIMLDGKPTLRRVHEQKHTDI